MRAAMSLIDLLILANAFYLFLLNFAQMGQIIYPQLHTVTVFVRAKNHLQHNPTSGRAPSHPGSLALMLVH